MNFFLGVINLDGAPVEEPLLEKATNLMRQIGPDGQSLWTDHQGGFCQTFLDTGRKDKAEHVLRTFGDRYLIAGEIRIDARDELLDRLRAEDSQLGGQLSDYEILLHAWLLWKTHLTECLIGDYSVVIWDTAERSLFCLRDHMGVRPFYYAQCGRQLIVSNVLNSLRLSPHISAELNDQAVVDFLTFGFNTQFDTTVYRDIHQLPPGHMLEASGNSFNIRRYWSLPKEDLLRYRKAYDYVDHFRECLDLAVKDRLENTDLGVAMSGGLDSTSIAASVSCLKAAQSHLSLYTLDIKDLWPEDEEAIHADLVAHSIGADLHVRSITSSGLFAFDHNATWRPPEPYRDAFRLDVMTMLGRMARSCRVGFTGHGADALLMPSPLHFPHLIQTNQWRRFLVDASRYYRVFHRRPPLNIRVLIKKRLERSPWQPAPPPWLQSDVAEKTRLMTRHQEWLASLSAADYATHPERPEACRDLASPIWPATLHRFDPQTSGVPIDIRHPYFDIRLIRYALRMPAMPWFIGKELLRRAMVDRLPERVRARTKSMPTVSPDLRDMRQLSGEDWKRHLKGLDKARKYIDVDALENLALNSRLLRSNEPDLVSLPIAFGTWLELQSP